MRPRAARALIAAITVSAVILGVAACASDVREAPPAAPSAPMPPTPSASASPEPAAEPKPSPSAPSPASEPPAPSPSVSQASTFDSGRYSIDDPASPWVVSNKLRPLVPTGYVPADLVPANVPYISNPYLRPAAASALAEMFAAAAAEGAGAMQIQNAYRSYETQVSVYGGWVSRVGQDTADAQSARPGHSEHQTGFALDITALPERCSIEQCFGDTAQGLWLAENAWRFGFVLRYPAGKTPVTGFIYEPWHFRYVGRELSGEMRVRGTVTLEEFFELPAAPDYSG